MSDLYSKASLVMNPQLVDTGKVYSIKPEDRKGDFTFSRSTAATRVNADGNIEKETQNLLTYSNDFSQWTFGGVTRTGGQSGYDGSNNAWLITATNVSGVNVNQIVNTSGVKTYSIYAKAGTTNWIRMSFNDTGVNSRAWFDLTNGVVGTIIGYVIDTEITSLGSGWYRCSISVNLSVNSPSLYLFVVDGNGLTSASVGDSVYIQDVQLEQGLVARDYIETTTAAVEGGITDNVPRLDYTDSSCPALLLEPQRTNALPHSEYFGTGYTLSNASLIENDAISPEGLQNATKIYPTSSGNYRNIKYSALSPATGLYTFSIFAKAGELDHLVLIDYDGSGVGVDFNLSTGVATNSATTPFDFVGMVDYGNGWYRCIATATDPYFYWILSDNGAVSVTANGTDGLYIWGAQAETASYATSYIPTYGTSVTRNADVCNGLTNAGNNGIINDYNTSVLVDLAEVISTSNVIRFVTLFSASGGQNPRVLLYGNSLQIIVQYRVTGQSDLTIHSSFTRTNQNKALIRLKDNKLALFHNGTKKGEITIVKGNDLEYLTLAESAATDSGYKLNKLLSFPSSLTDQEAIALTTI
jgi:hypothetical protein